MAQHRFVGREISWSGVNFVVRSASEGRVSRWRSQVSNGLNSTLENRLPRCRPPSCANKCKSCFCKELDEKHNLYNIIMDPAGGVSKCQGLGGGDEKVMIKWLLLMVVGREQRLHGTFWSFFLADSGRMLKTRSHTSVLQHYYPIRYR